MGYRRVQSEGAQVGGGGLLVLALEPQSVSELQVRVGSTRIKRERPPVGNLGLRQHVGVAQLARLLQCMSVLNPNRRITRISIESLAVKSSGVFPLPRVSRPIGESDQARL